MIHGLSLSSRPPGKKQTCCASTADYYRDVALSPPNAPTPYDNPVLAERSTQVLRQILSTSPPAPSPISTKHYHDFHFRPSGVCSRLHVQDLSQPLCSLHLSLRPQHLRTNTSDTPMAKYPAMPDVRLERVSAPPIPQLQCPQGYLRRRRVHDERRASLTEVDRILLRHEALVSPVEVTSTVVHPPETFQRRSSMPVRRDGWHPACRKKHTSRHDLKNSLETTHTSISPLATHD